MKHLLLFSGLCIFFLSSCEKEIPFKGEYKTRKLVVNALLNTNDSININLSHSLSVIDEGTLEQVENATISLTDTEGNALGSIYSNSSGIYEIDALPLPGKTYQIQVEHPDYATVEASQTIPAAPAVANWDTTTVRREGFPTLTMEFSIQDPLGEDYYMVELLRLAPVNHVPFGSKAKVAWSHSFLQSNNPQFFGYNANAGVAGEVLLLSDANFDGATLPLTVSSTDFSQRDTFGLEAAKIRVSRITKATYQYYTSYQNYQNSANNFFASPVQVFSNITGGFGLFGAAASQEFVLFER